MAKVDLVKNPIVQSPYVYLQAAGSDGSDKTVKGAHLRWDFLKSLGENHLAKGNHTKSSPYKSTLGFNRENDFIKIYRTPFGKAFFVTIDFNVNTTTVVNTNNIRAWKYILPVNNLAGVTTNVTVRFVDYTQYDAIRATQTIFDTKQLLNAYTGIVEVETDNKLSFYAEFNLGIPLPIAPPDPNNQKKGRGLTPAKIVDKPSIDVLDTIKLSTGYLRIESVAIPDTSDFSQKQVSCRKKFTNIQSLISICCENIQYLRFDYSQANWKEIRLYCYENYIAGVNGLHGGVGAWENVGDFSLTTDDLVMNTRFMPDDVDGSGGHWPKFNEANPTTGEFTVNKMNYANKWRRQGFTFNANNTTNNDLKGLQHFVHKYMELSKTDERALAKIPSDNIQDPTTQDISYVDMLRLMSLDYHVARILGLGHIDTYGELQAAPYLYCLEYKTFAKLETPHIIPSERTHIFMTVPVSQKDYRLPAAPVLLPLTYGISVDNGTSTPTLLTDKEGYAPFGNIRFININRGPFNFEKPFGPFYYDPTEFCLCDETQPIAYGLEYKENSEPTFRKPEICHDSEYFDASGLPETLPILEGGTPKIFTHQEIEEGRHEYWSYAINWFSRVSPLSNAVTAITNFPKKANLLPPFNFAVQLIQDEDPGILIPEKALTLTTQAEQTLLSAIPVDNDTTLVRTTFDWNHVHHHAHQYADYADIFFRRTEPLVVKGKIDSVSLLPGNRAQITTTSYDITSTFPKTTVIPTILSVEAARFEGSFFSSGGENYVVESIIANGANPTFIVKQIKQITATAGSANSGQYISNETFQSPQPHALFFLTENMGALANWDLRHSKRVYLEKFYTNAKVTLRFSPIRTKVFDIKQVSFVGGNTEIKVEKSIKFIPGLTLEYAVKHEIQAIAGNTFKIAGNATADFVPGKQFRVFANKANDGLYTVNNSLFVPGNTIITVNQIIPNNINIDGLIEIVVSRPVMAIDNVAHTFRIAGNKITEIDAAHCEYKLENDGSLTRYVVGGINDSVVFMPIFKKPPGNTRPMLGGTGFIQLIFQNYNLLPHPDPEVNWYKGTVRLKDIAGNMQVYPVTYIGSLVNQSFIKLAIVIQDPGFIPMDDPMNQSGGDIYTLDLNATQNANYHPAYKLYLTSDIGLNPTTGALLLGDDVNFQSEDILPLLGDPSEGSRQTLMAIRSYDIKNDQASFLSNPVVLLAQKIALPKQPNLPTGPLYATRPDFYGKSTYTFDTVLDGLTPYSVVFYRTSEDRVLDILYKKDTQKAIWTELDALIDPSNPDTPKPKHDPALWQILFEGQSNGDDFATYIVPFGSFTWPLPDNDTFFLTYETNKPLSENNPVGGHVYPFKGAFKFNAGTFFIYNKNWTPQQILKRAIQDAFLPLNEQPPIFQYFKYGTTTSSVKAKSRDTSGNLLDPLTNDIFPMIRILRVLRTGSVVVRFTDYTLDGASKSLYFYRVLEMDDKFRFSDPSLSLGPVLMVNAFPPDKPQIRKVITRLQNDVTDTPSSVVFDVNSYSENEGISKIQIYRATDEIDALSIRTMKKVKSIAWGTDLIDDFSDLSHLDFPPYGETLHYRIIAIREIEDVEDVMLPLLSNGKQSTVTVDLPSLPSDVSKASIVDVVNPSAPKLFSENGTTTVSELKNVVLKWKSTCYNGTYRLQKLNASGNWTQIYSEKVANALMQYPPLVNGTPDFINFPITKSLDRIDADGNSIYHRFRVQVENSSGLFNLSEFELTLAKGASDLQEIDSILSYSDANNNLLPVLKSSDFVSGASQPDQMVFTHLNGPLPAGHNAFVAIEISVSEDLGHIFTRTINAPGGNAVFNHGDGGLNFDAAFPNRIYTIRTKLFTDAAPAGAIQVFTLNYLSDTTIALQAGLRSSPAFNVNYYLGWYPDIQSAFGAQNYITATDHWLKYGMQEGRVGSPAFYASYYLEQYPNLQAAFGTTNYSAAINHWIVKGIQEGLRSSPAFDVRFYLEQHPDLQIAFGASNYLEAINHWILYGISEGRRSAPDFDVQYYLARYPDLQVAFGATNYAAAIGHWILQGTKEKRQGAP